MEKLTMNISEAAQILGISRPTMYRLIARGDFPVLRIGRRTLIPIAPLERWIEKQIGKEWED